MSDIILRSTARTQVQLHSLVHTLKQLPQRLRDEHGQDTIEYIGVLAVVAGVIAVVLGVVNGLGGTITSGVNTLINDVFNGTPPKH